MQSHFGRREVGREMGKDQAVVLEKSTRLLQAMVDVISSSGWLAPALAAMELSQVRSRAACMHAHACVHACRSRELTPRGV